MQKVVDKSYRDLMIIPKDTFIGLEVFNKMKHRPYKLVVYSLHIRYFKLCYNSFINKIRDQHIIKNIVLLSDNFLNQVN